MLVAAALVPAGGTYYLIVSGAAYQVFMDHLVHELAIGLSLGCSGFVAFVAVRCYQSSGEVFVGWVALALIGETLVYAPHGLFTRFSQDHMVLFLIYGPTSRLVMALLLLVGLLKYDSPAHGAERMRNLRLWLWIGVFCVINLALAWGSLLHPQEMRGMRLWIEYGALVVTGTAMIMLLARPKRSPLMRIYAFSLVGFMTSSVSFILASPWTHLWWYAHGIFAAAFLLLSYGVLQAFHSTGAFAGVFSQEQLMEYLRAAKENAEQTNQKLMEANAQLAILATTDSLTGVANRRNIVERMQHELEHARHENTHLAVLLIDLDHFKAINDCFGHPTGDVVLKNFVHHISTIVRSTDVVGRLGGEEFVVLMPDSPMEQAVAMAQLICSSARALRLVSQDHHPIKVSVSIGVALSGRDADSVSGLLRSADRRLYTAKQSGRDQVVWA